MLIIGVSIRCGNRSKAGIVVNTSSRLVHPLGDKIKSKSALQSHTGQFPLDDKIHVQLDNCWKDNKSI
jgi:hypothetical protein